MDRILVMVEFQTWKGKIDEGDLLCMCMLSGSGLVKHWKGTSPRRRWGSRNIPRALGRQPDVGGMVKCSAVEMSKPQSTKRLRLALDGRSG